MTKNNNVSKTNTNNNKKTRNTKLKQEQVFDIQQQSSQSSKSTQSDKSNNTEFKRENKDDNESEKKTNKINTSLNREYFNYVKEPLEKIVYMIDSQINYLNIEDVLKSQNIVNNLIVNIHESILLMIEFDKILNDRFKKLEKRKEMLIELNQLFIEQNKCNIFNILREREDKNVFQDIDEENNEKSDDNPNQELMSIPENKSIEKKKKSTKKNTQISLQPNEINQDKTTKSNNKNIKMTKETQQEVQQQKTQGLVENVKKSEQNEFKQDKESAQTNSTKNTKRSSKTQIELKKKENKKTKNTCLSTL